MFVTKFHTDAVETMYIHTN